MNILIVKPSSLGDVVHALPVLRLLKKHLPQSHIYWCIEEELSPLLVKDPDLAGLFYFSRRGWISPRRWVEALSVLRAARRIRFDWVIDLQSLARSGLMAWLANGQLTVGLDDPREGANGFYDVAVPRPTPNTHAVDWYLSVLPVLGVPVHQDFVWLPRRSDLAADVESQWPAQTAQHVVLQPGARWQNKRWPTEHFASLVRILARQFDRASFVILGGRKEQDLGSAIAAAQPDRCLDLTGRVSLPAMVEWVRSADVLVSNDTGPMHVAAALRKPIVALFGPTEPRRTGPYGGTGHVLQLDSLPCVPCLKRTCHFQRPMACMRELLPERVAAEVTGLLG